MEPTDTLAKLVASNMRRSVETVGVRFPPPPSEFQDLVKDPSRSGYSGWMREGSYSIRPFIYRQANRFLSPQASYFGLYALATAIRHVFLNVNYQLGGSTLLDFGQGLYGPSIALLYTAAYQGLQSFMALRGRVFCHFHSPFSEDSPHHAPGNCYVGVLTRQNRWIFEPRTRSHEKRWLELCQIYPAHIEYLPACFHELFRYMYPPRPDRAVPIVEILRNPEEHRIVPELRDHAPEFLRRIAQTRHGALYESAGADPRVLEALLNRETDTMLGIDQQAQEFRSFSLQLANGVTTEIAELLRKLDLEPEKRGKLLLSADLMWADPPELDRYPDQLTRKTLEFIADWLTWS